jgi:hypothetical protein
VLIYLSSSYNKIKIIDNKRFYWGNKGYVKYVPKKDSDGLIGFIGIYIIILVFGFIISKEIFNFLTEFGLNVIWEHKGIYINEIPYIMLSSFLSIIAILGIATAINKKQYITFNIYDILMKFKIQQKVIEMVIIISCSFIIYYVCAFLQNINDVKMVYYSLKMLILYSFILFIYLAFKCCLVIGNILFSNHGFELRALDNLYTNFWYKDIKIDTEKWDLSGVKYNLEYLLDKYYLNKITKLKEVKFYTVQEENSDLKFIYYISFILYYGFWFIGLLIFLFMLKIDTRSKITSIIMFWVVLSVIHKYKSLKLVLASILFDRCGYYFKFENKLKYFCSDVALIDFKCAKYIRYLKSILAFYRISLNKEDNEDAENLILRNIKKIDEVKKDDSYYILLYLILYIKYENNSNIAKWNEEYISIIKQNDNNSFLQTNSTVYQTINAVISDINRETKANDIKELRNIVLYKFISDICEYKDLNILS